MTTPRSVNSEKSQKVAICDETENEEEEEEESELSPDLRSQRPTPSPYKRVTLVFTVLLLWLGFSMRNSLSIFRTRSRITYASRYSKEFKFRPAASPIFTKTLKDGSIRIHGAAPTAAAGPESMVKKRMGSSKRRPRNPKAKKTIKGVEL